MATTPLKPINRIRNQGRKPFMRVRRTATKRHRGSAGWRSALGLTIALSLGAFTATMAAVPAIAGTTPTTLTVPMDNSGVDTLNPFLSYYNGALDAFGLIYPTLNSLSRDGKTGPYLATSWTTSTDNLTWTFQIQDGLKWSDGQPITAADIAWTFNLIMTNPTAATANGSLVANFASVTAPNATTLIITTKKPQSNMLYVSIPVSGIPIVPEHIWKSKVATLSKFNNETGPIVGYGPWVLQSYQTDQYEKFTANKDFKLGTEGAPHFDNLVIQLFKNSDAEVAALKSGQLANASVNSEQFNSLSGDSSLGTVQQVGNGWAAVEINSGAKTRTGRPIGTGNPILADPQVRTAIHWAIDKNKLVTNVIGGKGIAGAGYLPPAWPQWMWAPAPADAVSFDESKANSILDAAGYKKGSGGIRVDPKTGQQLSFRLGIHSDNPADAQTSQYLKGWLGNIGINVTIQSLSFSQLNANLSNGDWDMLMDGWTTGPDPTYLLSIQTCATLPDDKGQNGNTDSFYCNPEYDSLFNQQVTTLDVQKRISTVAQMQQILYQANADIILYYANSLDVYRKDTVTNLFSGSPDANGIYPAQSAFWKYLDASPPVAAADAGTSSSSNTIWFIVGAVVIIAVIGGGLALRRRSSSDVRE
jgi:peptide/nickel transport system substrate-binding protein